MTTEQIHNIINSILLLIILWWIGEPWIVRKSKRPKPPTVIPPGAYVINVAKEFSPWPYGRTSEDGDYNGELFRKRYLIPAMEYVYHHPSLDKKNDTVVVDISEISFLAASWINEVVNDKYIWENSDRVIFYSSDPANWPLVRIAEHYIKEWPKEHNYYMDNGKTK